MQPLTQPPLLRDLLAVQETVLLDGAWGTELRRRGALCPALPAAASLTQPHLVTQLANDYVTAGSQALTTNTFRASKSVLGVYAPAQDADALNAAATQLLILKDAVPMGNIAPLQSEARSLGFAHAEDSDWLHEQFLHQASALRGAGCRTALFETFTSLKEARIAIRAAQQARFDEVACCIFARPDAHGCFCLPGDEAPVAEVLQQLAGLGADIVGVNCVAGPEEALRLLASLPDWCSLPPLLVRPNAGIPVELDGALTHPVSPAAFGEIAPRLRDAGARLIGGCCGSSPRHIAAMRDALQA